MGDRCYCILWVKDPIPPELIEDHADHDDTERWFSFEEMNYARIPDELHDYLVKNKIAAVWTNGAGGGYGEGVMIYRDGEFVEWPTLDGDIVVSTKNLEVLPAAIEAQAFLEGFWK